MMRNILLACIVFGFFIALAIIGSHKENERNENSEPVVYDRSVTQIDINEAFIDNPKKWEACWNHESSIRDKEEGYISKDYERYPVVNIVEGHDYDFTVKGNDVYVTMTCDFIVFYQMNAFLTIKEDVSYQGGKFTLSMHHSSKGYLTHLTFN